MAIQSQPSRISEPFAGSGTKNVIPSTNTTPSASQAASWASGFPPECSQPISAGGCPVPRNDMNGVLNWLSQDFAFGQDGGIWEWSALADYDTQRMVRGSDGLLYWSVAQSGPGFGAGAVDPTTDDGTYWSSPALKTMPLSDKSMAGATTEWVKDLAVTPVYISPAGDDANDGLSAASAVQTFAKATEIGKTLPQSVIELRVAGGSYTEDITLTNLKCIVTLLGNISITGATIISKQSSVYFNDNNIGYSVSLIAADGSQKALLRVTSSSSLNFDVDTVFQATTTSNNFAFMAYDGASSCYFNKNVTVNQPNNDYENVCNCYGGSTVYVNKNFVVNSGSYYANRCFVVGLGSTVVFSDASTTSNTVLRGKECINVWNGSSVSVGQERIVEFYFSLWALQSEECSSIYISCNNTMLFSPSSAVSIMAATTCGSIYIYGSGTLTFNGSVSWAGVSSTINGSVWLATSINIVNNLTGKRYTAENGGQIFVNGAGANRLPGSTAGFANASNYGFYG